MKPSPHRGDGAFGLEVEVLFLSSMLVVFRRRQSGFGFKGTFSAGLLVFISWSGVKINAKTCF